MPSRSHTPKKGIERISARAEFEVAPTLADDESGESKYLGCISHWHKRPSVLDDRSFAGIGAWQSKVKVFVKTIEDSSKKSFQALLIVDSPQLEALMSKCSADQPAILDGSKESSRIEKLVTFASSSDNRCRCCA